MTMRGPIAARPSRDPDSPRAERLRWISTLLRRLLVEHEVSQDDLGHELGVEQSRVSRWCDVREPETIPLADVVALLRAARPACRALGLALLGELAFAGGAVVAPLPRTDREADDVVALGAAAKELGESLAAFGETIRVTDRGALLEARRQVREGIVAGVVMDRRLEARLGELATGPRSGPRKA